MAWDQPINGWEIVASVVLTVVAVWVGWLLRLGAAGIREQARKKHAAYFDRIHGLWEFQYNETTRHMVIKSADEARRVTVLPTTNLGWKPTGTLLFSDRRSPAGTVAEFDVPREVEGEAPYSVQIMWTDPKRPRWWTWWNHVWPLDPENRDNAQTSYSLPRP